MWKTKFATDDALDEVYGNESIADVSQDDGLDTTMPDEVDADVLLDNGNQASEPQAPDTAVEENKEQTTEVDVPENTEKETVEQPADVDVPNDNWEGVEEDPEKILNDLLGDIENKGQEVEQKTKEIQDVVENSSMSDGEKTDLLSKLSQKDDIIREKDDMISEWQLRHKSLEDKYSQAITENENYRIDSLGNKKVLDKIQSDPEVQEFVALKIRSDNWDEQSAQKLDILLKDMMRARGYDISALVDSKKKAEKMGMSAQSTPSYSAGEISFDDAEEGDALDFLK